LIEIWIEIVSDRGLRATHTRGHGGVFSRVGERVPRRRVVHHEIIEREIVGYYLPPAVQSPRHFY
jgi:hypothetical protein